MTNDRAVDTIAHTGLRWLDDSACADLDDESSDVGMRALDLFFVNAGHVIGGEALAICKRRCPVRTECITHAYTGLPGGLPIAGGYMGGFSLGQRKAMTLEQALELAARDADDDIDLGDDSVIPLDPAGRDLVGV